MKKTTQKTKAIVRSSGGKSLLLELWPKTKKPKPVFLRLHNGKVISLQDFLQNKGEKPFREIVLDIFVEAGLITELDDQCNPIILEVTDDKEENEEKNTEKKAAV